MKIALVHDHLNQYGGAERVLLALSEVFPEAPIYTLAYDKEKMGDIFKGKEIRTSFIQRAPFGIGKKFYKCFLPLMPQAIETFDLSEFDVVISSSSAFCKGVITKTNTKHICYCHTPTRYLWDDTHSYVADLKLPKILKVFLRSNLSKLRQWDFLSAQRVDLFIANSEFVKNRISKFYRKNSEIIYPPVDINNNKPVKKEDLGDYFLIVSRLRPYKKIDLAIQVFNELNKEFGDKYKLKIIGSGEYEYELKKMTVGENIEFLGFKNDDDKNYYISRCLAFINPQEEDFGITPVEAMMSGRPVIAYKKGGATETVIENKTGVFFEKQTIFDLKNSIINFNIDNFNPEEIQEYAKKFSKEQFKNKILETLKNTI